MNKLLPVIRFFILQASDSVATIHSVCAWHVFDGYAGGEQTDWM